ncbi:MAG: lysine--tRNA ligase [Thermoanaerobaculales bacterium]|nr:lysine--tRNA ligase [Thermoanaerobaculales bacterium]
MSEATNQQQPIEQLIANRLAKLDELRRLGVEPYPTRYRVAESVSDVRRRFAGASTEGLESDRPAVRLAGRLRSVRGHGKVSFADLSDGAEQLQLYLRKSDLDETSWKVFSLLDLGDFIGVEGTIFRTRTGELSVAVSRLEVLAKTVRPLPEKYHGLADREARARQRYLDLLSNPESRAIFETRSRIVSGIRRFLDGAGFVEVETPMMQPIPGGASARPFETHHNTLDLDLYLRIAPELYLKRLVVGGMERVYEINRNFRNEGISTRHNPEFTMLEFYWAYADYELLMDFTEEMITTVAEQATGGLVVPWGDRTIDFSRPWRRLTLRDAILEHSELTEEDLSSRERMEAAAERVGVLRISERSDGKLLEELYEMTAEPRMIDPTFIMDYPRDISPLTKSKPGNPEVVERFELFIGGLEVANAYTELNDPAEQRRRFEEQAAAGGGVVDEDFLLAIEHGMPPTGGEGVGIDRLVMLLTNQQSIRDVILFPQLRPRDSQG